MSAPGLILAAPASGSGKTVVTAGLLRALCERGTRAAAAKIGPDYIDAGYHTAATGRPCRTLDSFAMRPATLAHEAACAGEDADLVVAEGVMGAFDGAPDGRGSTAEVARLLGWPLVLVVDARGMAASAGALLHGFASFDPRVRLAGVIFNRVGSARHAARLREGAAAAGVPVLGCLPRDDGVAVGARHLGLVQAHERAEVIETAAAWVAGHLDLDALVGSAAPAPGGAAPSRPPFPLLGARIALAWDAAFSFVYPAVLDGWRRAGADLAPFSPLADEPPDRAADAIYLPGGFPERHAATLAAGSRWRAGVREAAARGVRIHGECGGYLALGETLADDTGRAHAMAGVLPLAARMDGRTRTLGYRVARDHALGAGGDLIHGHEFRAAEVTREGPADPVFTAWDAAGNAWGGVGCAMGRVTGTFIHVVDRDPR